MASEEICSDSTPDFPPKCRHFGTLNAIILHLFGLKTVETLTLRGFILIQQALSAINLLAIPDLLVPFEVEARYLQSLAELTVSPRNYYSNNRL